MTSLDLAEIPYVPPPRVLSYYLVLVCVVLPLWLVTPISWSFVIYTLYNAKLWSFSWNTNTRLYFAAALCEVRTFQSLHYVSGFTDSSQVLFSIYHYNLVRSVSGLPRYGPSNFAELQTGFERVLKTGLADLSVDEESLSVERPGSPAEHLVRLQPDDPRAIEFRECMRAWYSFARACYLSPRLTTSFQGFGEPRGRLSRGKISTHTFIGRSTMARSPLHTQFQTTTRRFSTAPSSELKIVLG